MEKSTTGTTPEKKELRRTREGRMIAGVCSGAGRYLGVDPNILRLALAAFTVFGGAGVLVYIVAWVLIPEEGQASSIAEDLMKKANENPDIQNAMQKAKDGVKEGMKKVNGSKEHTRT